MGWVYWIGGGEVCKKKMFGIKGFEDLGEKSLRGLFIEVVVGGEIVKGVFIYGRCQFCVLDIILSGFYFNNNQEIYRY